MIIKISELNAKIKICRNFEEPTKLLVEEYASLMKEYSDILSLNGLTHFSNPYKDIPSHLKNKNYEKVRDELNNDLSEIKSRLEKNNSAR